MAGSELALSLLADAAVAATLLGLLVSLQRMSRHPALTGAVAYGMGHLAYSAGSSVYSVMNAGTAAPSELLPAATAGLAVSILGTALMMDGMGRLLESPQRRGIRFAAWGLALCAVAVMPLAPAGGTDPFKLAADLVDVLAATVLAIVLWRRRATPPQRMPSIVAACCLAVLAALYSDPLTFAMGAPRWLPDYGEWVWLDLALWNTVNFCVVMLASFKALTAFAQRSRVDSLTGALNRDGLANEREVLALRHPQGVRLCVLAIDIDHFKRINDAHGHAAGDAYLSAFAATLRERLRGADLLARWGGEEFIVVLVGAPIDAAQRVAEGLRAAVEALVVAFEGRMIRTTTSIGIAEGHSEEAFEPLVARADAALYAAKREGRNRVNR
jgi:diguanylate cyclase (GGDEF)-like protein